MLHLLETAPTHGVPLLDELLIHDDRTTEPRVPWITDLSRLNIMGVALSTCIMRREHISPWRRTRRRHDAFRRRGKGPWSRSQKLADYIIATNDAQRDGHS